MCINNNSSIINTIMQCEIRHTYMQRNLYNNAIDKQIVVLNVQLYACSYSMYTHTASTLCLGTVCYIVTLSVDSAYAIYYVML
jgi:hypothetical protein